MKRKELTFIIVKKNIWSLWLVIHQVTLPTMYGNCLTSVTRSKSSSYTTSRKWMKMKMINSGLKVLTKTDDFQLTNL